MTGLTKVWQTTGAARGVILGEMCLACCNLPITCFAFVIRFGVSPFPIPLPVSWTLRYGTVSTASIRCLFSIRFVDVVRILRLEGSRTRHFGTGQIMLLAFAHPWQVLRALRMAPAECKCSKQSSAKRVGCSAHSYCCWHSHLPRICVYGPTQRMSFRVKYSMISYLELYMSRTTLHFLVLCS